MKNKVYVNTNTTDYHLKTGHITEYEAAISKALAEHTENHRKCYESSYSENRLSCDIKPIMERYSGTPSVIP